LRLDALTDFSSMPPIPSSSDAAPANDANGIHAARAVTHVAAPFWRVLATSGYGLWAWLGMALVLGRPDGRSGTLVPLAAGLLLAGFGLVLACLPGRGATHDWYGWQPYRDSRPTRAALLAFVTYLPMLGVAGLARGDNDFWATRLAGAALALCSLASLAYNHYDHRRRWLRPAPSPSSLFPVRRLLFAGYAGGLCLWAVTVAQGQQGSPFLGMPWLALLLGLAMVTGLMEWRSWRSLGHRRPARTTALRSARCVSALLAYVVPALALLLAMRIDTPLLAATLAAPSALLGRWLEQRQFAAVRRNDIIS
jgi:hypothetical protein